jgi:hypothetical protein
MPRKVHKSSFLALGVSDGVETAVGQVLIEVSRAFEPGERLALRMVCGGWAKVLRPPTLVYVEADLALYLKVFRPGQVRDKDAHLDLAIRCADKRVLTAVRDLVRRMFAQRLVVQVTPEQRSAIWTNFHALIAATYGYTVNGRRLVDCVHDLMCCCANKRVSSILHGQKPRVVHIEPDKMSGCAFESEAVIDSLAAMGDVQAVSHHSASNWHFKDQEIYVALTAAKHGRLGVFRWIKENGGTDLFGSILAGTERKLLSCPLVWEEMCRTIAWWAQGSEILFWRYTEEHILATITSGDLERTEEIIGVWTEEYEEDVGEALENDFACDCYVAAIESGSIAMLELVVSLVSVLRPRSLRIDLQEAIEVCYTDMCDKTWYFERRSRKEVCAVIEAIPGTVKLDGPLVLDFSNYEDLRFDVYMALRKMDLRLPLSTRLSLRNSADTAQRMQLPPGFIDVSGYMTSL